MCVICTFFVVYIKFTWGNVCKLCVCEACVFTRQAWHGWWWCACEAWRSHSSPGSYAPPDTTPSLRCGISPSPLWPGRRGMEIAAGGGETINHLKINLNTKSAFIITILHCHDTLCVWVHVHVCMCMCVPARYVRWQHHSPCYEFCVHVWVRSKFFQCRKSSASLQLDSELRDRHLRSHAGNEYLHTQTWTNGGRCLSDKQQKQTNRLALERQVMQLTDREWQTENNDKVL